VITLDLLGHGRSDRPRDMWRYSMTFFGEQTVALLMKVVQRVANLVPRGALPFLTDVALDALRQDPGPSGAVLEGLFFGRTAPHRFERRTFTAPALVIGHRRDPVHPFSDAGMLADELPNGRLLEASSILELRVAPKRLTGEIADFVDECWAQASASEDAGEPRPRARAS
jgi:pimeloyl-ACP methyl ester carboxylesterase